MSAATALLRPADPRLTVAIASRAGLRMAWQELLRAALDEGWPLKVISRWVLRLPGAEPGNWNTEWRQSIDEAARADVLLARICADDRADVIGPQIGAALGAGRRVAVLGSHPLLERLEGDPLVTFWAGSEARAAIRAELERRGLLAADPGSMPRTGVRP